MVPGLLGVSLSSQTSSQACAELVNVRLMQGMSMALYTQVTTTAGYVGLNALEYIMQTVSRIVEIGEKMDFWLTCWLFSTLTRYSTPLRPNSSTPPTGVVPRVCYRALEESLESSLRSPDRISSPTSRPGSYGSERVVSGFQQSCCASSQWR